jgi:hypothetical protein
MRGLTVREPWGTGIVHLGKPVENRSRNIAGAYRGWVALHTSKARRDDDEYVAEALASPHFAADLGDLELVRGHVIGVARLVDVHAALDCWRKPWKWETEDVAHGDHCSPWAMPDLWHLDMEDQVALPRPIPWRGQMGLWRVPDELEAAIREQVDL